jgi:hypothetical protein
LAREDEPRLFEFWEGGVHGVCLCGGGGRWCGVVGVTVLLPDPLALSDERLEEWWCGGEQLG